MSGDGERTVRIPKSNGESFSGCGAIANIGSRGIHPASITPDVLLKNHLGGDLNPLAYGTGQGSRFREEGGLL